MLLFDLYPMCHSSRMSLIKGRRLSWQPGRKRESEGCPPDYKSPKIGRFRDCLRLFQQFHN